MPTRTPWRDRHPLTLSAALSAVVSVGAAGGVIWAAVSYLHTDDEARAHARQDQIARLYMQRAHAELAARTYRNEAWACRAWRRPAEICAGYDADAASAAGRIAELNRAITEVSRPEP